MTTTSNPLKAQFTTNEMAAAVDVANANGLKVTVHARGVEGIRAAIRAGVHGVEHARMEVPPGKWEFDDELAREMADRGGGRRTDICSQLPSLPVSSGGREGGCKTGRYLDFYTPGERENVCANVASKSSLAPMRGPRWRVSKKPCMLRWNVW